MDGGHVCEFSSKHSPVLLTCNVSSLKIEQLHWVAYLQFGSLAADIIINSPTACRLPLLDKISEHGILQFLLEAQNLGQFTKHGDKGLLVASWNCEGMMTVCHWPDWWSLRTSLDMHALMLVSVLYPAGLDLRPDYFFFELPFVIYLFIHIFLQSMAGHFAYWHDSV